MNYVKTSSELVFTITQNDTNPKPKKVKEDNKFDQYVGNYINATFEKKVLKNQVKNLKVQQQEIDQELGELEDEEALLLKQLEKIQKENISI